MSTDQPGDVSTLLSQFGSPRAQAVAAAYAIVSVYDGKVDEAELGRFVEIALEGGFEMGPAALAKAIEGLVGALADDREKGDPVIFAAIEAVKDDADAVAAVTKAAKEAILADARVDVRERLVLREIAEHLDVDPNAI